MSTDSVQHVAGTDSADQFADKSQLIESHVSARLFNVRPIDNMKTKNDDLIYGP